MHLFNKTTLNIIIGFSLISFLGWYFSDIVFYFFMALVLSSILRTPTNYISQTQVLQFKIPRVIAILISFGFLLGIITLFVLLFIPVIVEQIGIISDLDYTNLISTISEPFQSFEQFLEEKKLINPKELGIDLIDKEGEKINPFIDQLQKYTSKSLKSLALSAILNNILSFTGNFFIALLAVLFIAFFLLYEKGMLRKLIIQLIPNKYFEVTIGVVYKVERLLANYLLGLLIQMVFIFAIAATGLLIINVKYAITIALFAALANLIPYLGPGLGASFGLIVSFSTSFNLLNGMDYVFFSLKILLVFLVVQLVDNLILQPVIFSKSIKAHPLETFIAIFAGAAIAGALGMIVAIPVYTLLRVSYIELRRGYKEYHVFQIKK